MVKRTDSKNADSKSAAPHDDDSVDCRRDAWEALAEFTGRYRGYPLTDWLIQTRQAEVAARGAVLARLKGDE